MRKRDILRMWVQLVKQVGREKYTTEEWEKHYIDFWCNMTSTTGPSILMDSMENIISKFSIPEETEETVPLSCLQKRLKIDENNASVTITTKPKRERKKTRRGWTKKRAANAVENVFETITQAAPSTTTPLNNTMPIAGTPKRGRPRLTKTDLSQDHQQNQPVIKKNTKKQEQNTVKEPLIVQPSEKTTIQAAKMPKNKRKQPEKTNDFTEEKPIIEKRVTRSQMRLKNTSPNQAKQQKPQVKTKAKRTNLNSKAMVAPNETTAHNTLQALDLSCKSRRGAAPAADGEYVSLADNNGENLSLPKLKLSAEQELDDIFNEYKYHVSTKSDDFSEFDSVTVPMSSKEKANYEMQDMLIEEAMLLVDPLASHDISQLLADDIDDVLTDDIPCVDDLERCLSSFNDKTLTEIDQEMGDTSEFFDNMPSLPVLDAKTPLDEDAQLQNELDYDDDNGDEETDDNGIDDSPLQNELDYTDYNGDEENDDIGNADTDSKKKYSDDNGNDDTDDDIGNDDTDSKKKYSDDNGNDDTDDDIDAISVATSWNGDDDFSWDKKLTTNNQAQPQNQPQPLMQEKLPPDPTCKSSLSKLINYRIPKKVVEVSVSPFVPQLKPAQEQKTLATINQEQLPNPTVNHKLLPKATINHEQLPQRQAILKDYHIPKKVCEVSVNPFVQQVELAKEQQPKAQINQKKLPQRRAPIPSIDQLQTSRTQNDKQPTATNGCNAKPKQAVEASVSTFVPQLKPTQEQPKAQTDQEQLSMKRTRILSLEQRQSTRYQNMIQQQTTNACNTVQKKIYEASVSPFQPQQGPPQLSNSQTKSDHIPNRHMQMSLSLQQQNTNRSINIQPIPAEQGAPLFAPPIRLSPERPAIENKKEDTPINQTFGIMCWKFVKGICQNPHCNHNLYNPGEVQRRLNQQRYDVLMENYSIMKLNGILFKTYFLVFANVFFRRGMVKEMIVMVKDCSFYLQLCAPFIVDLYKLLIRSGMPVELASSEFMKHLWQPNNASVYPEIFTQLFEILRTADWYNHTENLESLFSNNFPIPESFLLFITQEAIKKKQLELVQKIVHILIFAPVCVNQQLLATVWQLINSCEIIEEQTEHPTGKQNADSNALPHQNHWL